MTALWTRALPPLMGLLLAPLLLGLVGRVKAQAGGRRGTPLLQPYRDLLKFLRKGAVFSETATFVFRAGPAVSLAALLSALLLLPAGPLDPPFSFSGDVILFAYLLALSRFATLAAALDTGSSFEGMGASREAAFSALGEPAFFLVLCGLCWNRGSLRLAELFGAPADTLAGSAPALLLVGGALFLLLLAENARIPVDDPATHLELTMIHEVMVLDHSGPDLALVQYGAAVKLWIFSSLLAGLFLPPGLPPWLSGGLFLGGILLVALLVGAVESSMARLRLSRVPQLLGLAAVLAGLAVLLLASGGGP